MVLRSIYNRLPFRIKKVMRERLYQLSYYYGLERLTAKAEIRDGFGFVELKDGAMFYGRKDALNDATLVISKLGKLGVLKDYGVILSLLCYQYVAREYERYHSLEKGDVVVDAGANIGTFTIRAARAVGDKGLVVAIEPAEDNLEILRMNVEVNNLKNIIIVPKGIWKEKGNLGLRISCHQAGHSLPDCRGCHSEYNGGHQLVAVDTLDGILEELGVSRVDFLKLDIEGAEAVSMDGMRGALLSDDVYVVTEVSHIYQGQTTGEFVKRFLENVGLEVKEKADLIYAWRGIWAN